MLNPMREAWFREIIASGPKRVKLGKCREAWESLVSILFLRMTYTIDRSGALAGTAAMGPGVAA